MKKLVFCDIDGTILDGSRGMNEFSYKTRYAFEELKKQDYVFVASGRCKGLLDRKIIDLAPNGYVLCNGAYAELDGKPIHEVYFDAKAQDKIKEITLKYNGFYIMETLEHMYVDSLTSDSFSAFMSGWGRVLEGFREDESANLRYMIAMIGFMDKETLHIASKELAPYVDIFDHKQFSSCDVNIKGVNKATGVKKVIEYLGIPKEDTYCFGDAINDLEMLECVGHPVIVANCVDELKGRGFEETDDVLDDGFYNYLVSNKLIKAI
ncbi:MAG: HAD family phosphatase [Erysipelotrichaceae bacterium]|nr:HAD family phosphatase [Erysipelotrichaceae bacterium]